MKIFEGEIERERQRNFRGDISFLCFSARLKTAPRPVFSPQHHFCCTHVSRRCFYDPRLLLFASLHPRLRDFGEETRRITKKSRRNNVSLSTLLINARTVPETTRITVKRLIVSVFHSTLHPSSDAAKRGIIGANWGEGRGGERKTVLARERGGVVN